MWIVETCIRGDIMVQVLYKLCDMWITYLTGIDWQQATVLYKLCDMWMGVVKILQNELGEFYINYVICELFLYKFI